ncbi:MAG: YVTN family beta-propeller protein [Myxococcota bacterium]|jgi:YVTN family beta-propeller protein
MRRLAIAVSILAAGACATPGEPETDGDKTVTPISAALPGAGWGIARKPAPPPEPREVTQNFEAISALPDTPVRLDNPTYEPSATSRALVATTSELYVVDSDNGRLIIINRTSGKVHRSIFVGSMPEQVVVDSDGTAFVSLRHGHAVARISASSDVPVLGQVGTEPMGLALSPDQQTVFVAVRGDGALVALDAGSMSELDRAVGLDRPRTIVASPNGRVAVAGRSNQVAIYQFDALGYGLPTLSRLDEQFLRRTNPSDLALHGPSNILANRVMAGTLHAGSAEPLFVHHLTRPGDETTLFNAALNGPPPGDSEIPDKGDGQDTGGYGAGGVETEFPHLIRPVLASVTRVSDTDQGETARLPVVDPLTNEPLESLIAQPSDINHHPKLSLAFVTGFGSDNVLVLNTSEADPMLSPVGIIRVGKAPKAITFSPDGNLAYVLNAHDFTISEIDITPFSSMSSSGSFASNEQPLPDSAIRLEHTREVRFGDDPLAENARLGRRVFTYAFNPKLSRDNQFACRTCHIDGAEDGLVWMVPEGPRQTPALAGRLHDTAPFNWVGSEGELQNNMEQTIERMGGGGLDAKELASLEQFLLVGLTPPPNPNVAPAGLTEEQQRGQALFNDPMVGCSTCHAGGALTDGRLHDVGTINELEFTLREMTMSITGEELPLLVFNTPTLRGLHATAPYLHDGSAATLHDTLIRTATTMGKTDHLNDAQRDDLVAYLLTL